MGLGLTILVLD